MAPSTAPTVLQTHTAPPLTVSRDLSERHSARVGGDLGRHGRSRPRVDERCKACRSVGVGSRCCATGLTPWNRAVQDRSLLLHVPSNACNPGSHCLPGCRTNHRVRCRGGSGVSSTRSRPRASGSSSAWRERQARPRPAMAACLIASVLPSCRVWAKPRRCGNSACSTASRVPEPGSRSSQRHGAVRPATSAGRRRRRRSPADPAARP